MKIRKFIKKIFSLLLILSIVFSILEISTYANTNTETEVIDNLLLDSETLLHDNEGANAQTVGDIDDAPRLDCIISSPSVLSNEIIHIEFETNDIIDYSYVSTGLTVVSNTNDPLQFDVISNSEFGSLEVYAEASTGEILNQNIYIQ